MTTEQPEWVSSNEVRTKFREILDGVAYGGQHVRVQRYGRPAAVIVPSEWHEARQDVTDLGRIVPDADRPSRHRWEPATSIAQARARVIHEMDFLEQSCTIALDANFAQQCLIETLEDYIDMAFGLIS